MILEGPVIDLDAFKGKDLILLICEKCGNKLHRIKNEVRRALNGARSIRFCSHSYTFKGEENLILLCPNCHSLTATYGALNKGRGRTLRK
jgi:Zn finger protein HypA/HybF involved in hydrogenase expression